MSQGGWKTVTTMVAISFAFGVVNILLKKVDVGTSNLVIVTYRLLFATLSLTPIAYFLERKKWIEAYGSRFMLPLRYCINRQYFFRATLTQYFFLMGLKYTSATFSCAFINMVPINTFVMALPFGIEKLDVRSKGGLAKFLGAVISIGGAMQMTLYKGMSLNNIRTKYETIPGTNRAQIDKISPETADHNWVIGSIILAAAILLWSSWFLMQAKIGKMYPSMYSSTDILSFFGTIEAAILCGITERDLSVWKLKGKVEITGILYAGMVGSGLCYVWMSWCVKQRAPVFTTAFSPLAQIFLALFEFSTLQEQIHLGSVLGSTMVILGLYLLLWVKSKNEIEDCSSTQQQASKTDTSMMKLQKSPF